MAETVPAKLCDLGDYQDLLSLTPLKTDNGTAILPGTFVACSKRLYDDIQSDHCRLDGNLRLIHHWTKTGSDAASKRHYFKPGSTKLRLIYAGWVGENKGIDIILNAIKLLIDDGEINFYLDIYGDGNIEACDRMCADLGIKSFVRCHGFKTQDELRTCYGKSDVLLFPSMLREPFGNVVLEAGTAGCVPVINKHCGAAEWLTAEDGCVKVERNAHDFATAIRQVLHGKLDLAAMARKVSRSVGERFNLSAAAKQYEEVLSAAARPFHYDLQQWENARLLAGYVERLAFAQVQRDFAKMTEHVNWLEHEVTQLGDALKEAKKGVKAFDEALVGAQNELAATQHELTVLKNSRIWKLRNILRYQSDDKTE